ncbi:MAG TPA: GxxExxY protein [Candidatus Angelobacter sp.]|nr:GxxExxY protein [Candidatus Angelobacter sp.]
MSFSPQRAQRNTEESGINSITSTIIGAAMKVHSALGPGLLEKAYSACVAYELRKLGFDVKVEVELPVIYESVRIDFGYRIDLLVNDLVVVEFKCVEKISPVHEAQIISYMRMCKKSVGLLINFHVRHLRDGIKRFVEGTDWN